MTVNGGWWVSVEDEEGLMLMTVVCHSGLLISGNTVTFISQ